MKSRIEFLSGHSRERGSLFILSIWLLLMLSFFTLAIGHTVHQQLRIFKNLQVREELRLIAEAGVKKAIAVLNRRDPQRPIRDSLAADWSANPAAFQDVAVGPGAFSVNKFAYGHGDSSFAKMESLRFGMMDEESKINLNLTTDVVVLTRLFQAAMESESDTMRDLAEAVMDFKDEDDSSYASGAESRYYRNLTPPYEPKNAKIDTLEELLWVKGMRPEIFVKIKPLLTLHSSGKINVNTASFAALAAIGFEKTLALKILDFRNGPDRTPGTGDDGFLGDLTALAPALAATSGLEEAEKARVDQIILEGQITVSSEYFQIQSIGKIKNRQQAMVIQCVVERYGEILQWREFYVTVS